MECGTRLSRTARQRRLSRPRRAAFHRGEVLAAGVCPWARYRLVSGIEPPRPDCLGGVVGFGCPLLGFLSRVRLRPLAGFGFGHVFFAFLNPVRSGPGDSCPNRNFPCNFQSASTVAIFHRHRNSPRNSFLAPEPKSMNRSFRVPLPAGSPACSCVTSRNLEKSAVFRPAMRRGAPAPMRALSTIGAFVLIVTGRCPRSPSPTPLPPGGEGYAVPPRRNPLPLWERAG